MEDLNFIQQFITIADGFVIALICFFVILATYIFKLLLKEKLNKLKKKTRAVIIISFSIGISIFFSIFYTYFAQHDVWYFIIFKSIKNAGIFAFISVFTYDGVKDKINLFLGNSDAKDINLVEKK